MLVMECIDHDAGSKKEEGLEECMRHEMENGRTPRPDTERKEHITDLADGRIGQYTFDVALSKRAEAGQQKCCSADYCDDELNLRRQLKERMGSRDQIYAGSHHRGCMDKSARWCWSRHGVRQPCLQGQLCGFTDRAT